VPEVFIDGEKVVFEGTLPATLGELQALLERALGDAGRVLASLSIPRWSPRASRSTRSPATCCAFHGMTPSARAFARPRR
jgi:hypothetical protein